MTDSRQLALEALKISVQQNGCDMLMMGDELRKCEAAIKAIEADLAAKAEPVGMVIKCQDMHLSVIATDGRYADRGGVPVYLAAPQQAEAPAGWQLVPIEPTYQMLAKALFSYPVFDRSINAMASVYATFLLAAP